MKMSSQDNINYMKEKVEDFYDWLKEGLHMIYNRIKSGTKWIWKKIKDFFEWLKFGSKPKLKMMKVHNEKGTAIAFGVIESFIGYTNDRLKNGDFTLKEMKLYLSHLKTLHSNEKKMKPVMDLLDAKIKAWENARVSP